MSTGARRTPWASEGTAASPAWIELVRRKMEEIEADDSDIRAYGGTNEAEFFAVASECFRRL